MITEKARPEILTLVRQHYPQLAERNLQEEIANEGTIMHFKTGSLIMDFGAYIKVMPLIIKGSIKVSREDEQGNELFLLGYGLVYLRTLLIEEVGNGGLLGEGGKGKSKSSEISVINILS